MSRKSSLVEQAKAASWPHGDAPADLKQGRQPAPKLVHGILVYTSHGDSPFHEMTAKLRGTPLCPAAVAKTVMFKGYSD